MTLTEECAAELLQLASLVRCLPPPNYHRPEAFHEARSELARSIERVVGKLKGPETRTEPRAKPPNQGTSGVRPRHIVSTNSRIVVGGRSIEVQTRRAAFAT